MSAPDSESIARFTRLLAPLVLLPMSAHESLAAYLRIVELGTPGTIAERLGISYFAAKQLLRRAKLKLDLPADDYGWYWLIAEYHYARGRESVRAAG